MARQHGIAAATYDKLLLDSGGIYTDFVTPAAPGTLLGATRGGSVFKRLPTYKDTPYEGVPGQVVGQKHLVGEAVTLETTIISFDTDNLNKAIPNSAVTSYDANYNKIEATEWDADAVHVLNNIAILAQLSGKTIPVIIILDNPICEKDLSLAFKDKSEAASKWLFSAFYDEATGFSSPPWRILWPK